MTEKLERGKRYRFSYTRPIYDKSRHRYAQDNFRFTNPIIADVFYGGRCEASRYCAICGRKGVNSRILVRTSDMKELYVSDHCFNHPSSRLWDGDTDVEEIVDWYAAEDLTRKTLVSTGDYIL